MNLRKSIENEKELEFAVFCIESIAARMGVDAKRVYTALSEKSDILENYIIPEYEILHTQSKDYIVEDIMEVMWEKGGGGMNANPVLLQKKYTRIIILLAKEKGISLDQALSFFYHSELYDLLSEGISDMHCMSDEYLVKDLEREYERCNVFNNTQTNSMEM